MTGRAGVHCDHDMTATVLTFTGSADPEWPGRAGPGPDPGRAGCVGLLSLASPSGAALVIRWFETPDDAYLQYWTGAASAAGLSAGPVEIGPDAAVVEYAVERTEPGTRGDGPPHLGGDAPLKGVPCIIVKK